MVCRSHRRPKGTDSSRVPIPQLMRVAQTRRSRQRYITGTTLKSDDCGDPHVEQILQKASPLTGTEVWPRQPFEQKLSSKNSLESQTESFKGNTEKFLDFGQQINPLPDKSENVNTSSQMNSMPPRSILSDLGVGAEEECFTGATDLIHLSTPNTHKNSATQDFIDLSLGAQEECYAMTTKSQEVNEIHSLDRCKISREKDCSIEDDENLDESANSTNKDASRSYKKMLERSPQTPDESAQRLFRKRMLVLYHWLQPGVTNSQLNSILTKTWDSLPSEERDYYLTQGKAQPTNLKTNPQLHSITEIPGQQPNISEDEAAVDALLQTFSEAAGEEREESSPSPTNTHTPKGKKKRSRCRRGATLLSSAGIHGGHGKRPKNLQKLAMCCEDELWDLNLTDPHLQNESDIFWEDVPTIKELFHMTE